MEQMDLNKNSWPTYMYMYHSWPTYMYMYHSWPTYMYMYHFFNMKSKTDNI
jgi:hypothetical protein